MGNVEFGWITNYIARGDARLETMLPDNQRMIEKMRGVFSTLWFDDHFMKDHAPLLESWTTLSYLAGMYPDFKVGTAVMCQSYRNPGLMAKMMGSLQFISGGRYIAGIGAGWKEDEYLAYGYPYPPLSTRFEQLEETVQILKAMWSQSPATFQGKHYHIENAESEPLPVPPPPILIGGGGEKRTLRLVAQYADWMNIPFATPDIFRHKLNVLRNHCQDVGRDYDEIKKSAWLYLYITPDGEQPAAISGDRFVMHGNPEQIAEQLKQYVDIGIEHFMLRFQDFPSTDGLDAFIKHVAPAFMAV